MSRSYRSTTLVLLLTCVGFFAQAQVTLPQASTKAAVSATIGVTEIAIKYTSPAVRGRNLWGELVPYDKVWRAGANEATLVSFSTEVNIEGTKLPAGTYAFFLTPTAAGNWKVHFNSDTQLWGEYGYDPAKDVITVEVAPKPSTIVEERLTYTIKETKEDQGYIMLAWEKQRIIIRFAVNTHKIALANIDQALTNGKAEEKWSVLAESAEYLLKKNENLEQALTWAKESTTLKAESWNYYILAQIQAKMTKFADAAMSAQKAIDTGEKNAQDGYYQFYKSTIAKMRDDWKSKG